MGHGSTMGFNKSVMERHAEILRERGHPNVRVGFNEASSPLIDQALSDMARAGVDEVVCIPFFIASGLHVIRDMPGKLGIPEGASEGTALADGRQVKVHYERPFGKDPLLTDLLEAKARELDKGGKVGVLLVSHGSRLPHNREIALHHADELRRRGLNVEATFNEYNEPDLDDSLERMLASGVDQVVVLPLFISLGMHLVKEIPARLHLDEGGSSGTIERDGRQVLISMASPLGPDPRLSDLLEARIRKHYG